jgi:NADPH:quinone reductase-like Zn-dependent oxidoreductase
MATVRADESTSPMRAIVRHRYGDLDRVVRQERRERPSVGPDEVLLEVHAAGIDRGVLHLMTGRPLALRAAGYGFRRPKNPVLGREVSGVVVDVGTAVTTFAIGDEVFGVAEGSFAEHALASPAKLARKPLSLDHREAAALTISALTAFQGVRDHGSVTAGQRVLITGASGGVGSYAVQLAKAAGAHVTGVAGSAKTSFVRTLGADEVVDYTLTDPTELGPFDTIIDIAGNHSIRHLRRALTRDGTAVIQGGETEGRWLGGSDRQLRAVALTPFVRQKFRTFVCRENSEDLEELGELAESGSVRPFIDRSFELDDTVNALEHLRAGHARGKVVVLVRPAS